MSVSRGGGVSALGEGVPALGGRGVCSGGCLLRGRVSALIGVSARHTPLPCEQNNRQV